MALLEFYRCKGPCRGPLFWGLSPKTTVGALLLAICMPLRAAAPLPSVDLTIGGHVIRAELAQSPSARQEGLMHRTRLGEDSGMLFVFDTPDTYCFWMKNTLIPLSIAFIGAGGRIVSIQDMQPETLDAHCPPTPVTLALEMTQGWFREAGITQGAQVRSNAPIAGLAETK